MLLSCGFHNGDAEFSYADFPHRSQWTKTCAHYMQTYKKIWCHSTLRDIFASKHKNCRVLDYSVDMAEHSPLSEKLHAHGN